MFAFVDGESLRDRLNREKQLPVDAALKIAREVADALIPVAGSAQRRASNARISPGTISGRR